MAARHGIQTLLEKADLQQFAESFANLEATKISHFVDVGFSWMSCASTKTSEANFPRALSGGQRCRSESE